MHKTGFNFPLLNTLIWTGSGRAILSSFSSVSFILHLKLLLRPYCTKEFPPILCFMLLAYAPSKQLNLEVL